MLHSGAYIYNVSDPDGWCYVAICKLNDHNICTIYIDSFACGVSSTTPAPTTTQHKPCDKPPLKVLNVTKTLFFQFSR